MERPAEKQAFKFNIERRRSIDVFPQGITRALLNLISNAMSTLPCPVIKMTGRRGAHVQMPHQIKTGHPRHTNIGNEAIECFVAIESRQKIRCGHEARGSDLMSSQVVTQGVEYSRIIVNQRQTNLLSHALTFSLSVM